MLLSDEEIAECVLQNMSDTHSAVRAIEAAILEKLASAEFPEPVAARWPSVPGSHHYAGAGGCGHGAFGEESEDLFTADQLTAWGNTRYAQGAAAQLSEKPSAWIQPDFAPVRHDGDSLASWINAGWSPLYTRREAK